MSFFLFSCINRIRLEFKDSDRMSPMDFERVLIESDWNLKGTNYGWTGAYTGVLIESDWNLKMKESINPDGTISPY